MSTTLSTSNISGMAAAIRNATESETFDLAGCTVSTIEHTIRDAFTTPFDHLLRNNIGMIRITLITGAGKLGRSKYDEHAARTVTTILRDTCGYIEDRGASAIIECAGSYKLQHDTGKNLKTVVIFPKINNNNNITNDNTANGNTTSTSTTNSIQKGMEQMGINSTTTNGTTNTETSIIKAGSIEEKLITTTPISTFTKMIQTKCETWNQKKLCCQVIVQYKDIAEQIDQKLIQGREPLTNSEQEYYNTISISSLEERITCIKELMTKQVDAGLITIEDKKVLLEQMTDRMKALVEEINTAKQLGKTKRVETLQLQYDKVQQRYNKVQSITPIPLPKLKYEDDINKLRKEQLPLIEIEKIAKTRLLSIKETQSVTRKNDIDIEIQALQNDSRQWYETDDIFQLRIQASQSNWIKVCKQQMNNANKKKTTTSSTSIGKGLSNTTTTTKWMVPGGNKSNTNAWNTTTTTANKSNGTKKTIPKGSGGLFAAMMNDSDSD